MSTISNVIQIIYIVCHYNIKKNTKKNRQYTIETYSNRQCNSYLDSVITMKYRDGVALKTIRLY